MNYIRHHITTEMEMSDFYCGCGGSSRGARQAGVRVHTAANHWKLALETHQYNHPETNHHLVDLLLASPANFPYTDIAWFSPECTWHSLAMGKRRKNISQQQMFGQMNPDPAAERSRVTMWDVVRFSEYHKYQVVIVENVVEIKYWPPFNSWIKAMESLGYVCQICYFNSRFFHPLNGQSVSAPQNRDRLYIVCHLVGNKAPDLNFRPMAWCEGCEKDIKAVQIFKKSVFPLGNYDTTGGRGQYFYACPDCKIREKGHLIPRRVEPYYFAAYNIINWDLPIPKIGERDRPLKPKTLQRIRVGLEKFGQSPLMVELSRSHALNNRATPVTGPMPTQTTRQTLAFIVPFKGPAQYLHGRPASEPSPTLTTAGSPALVTAPWLVEMYGNGDIRPASEVVNTVTGGGLRTGIMTVQGFISTYYSQGDGVNQFSDPIPAVTTQNHAALITTGQPFVASYYGNSEVHGVSEPIFCLTTKDRHSLVIPEIDINECGFRMFEPNECKKAQGFGDDYLIMGARKYQIKQIGNAVSTPPAEYLVAAARDSLN